MVGNAEERKPENIKKILDTYHPGAIRYHNAPKEEIWAMADCLQKTTKIPLLIASNCEAGGNGGTGGGTPIANGAAMAAIDSEEAVTEMATISFWGICSCRRPTIRYRSGVQVSINAPVIRQGNIRRV